MGWRRLVGSLYFLVSFAKETHQNRDLFPKKPSNLGNLLIITISWRGVDLLALLRCPGKVLPLLREICGVFCTSTPHCNLLQQSITRQHTAARCSTLPHTATYSNTLQLIATSCNKLQHTCVLCAQCVCMLQLTHTLNYVKSSSYHLHIYQHNSVILAPRHNLLLLDV